LVAVEINHSSNPTKSAVTGFPSLDTDPPLAVAQVMLDPPVSCSTAVCSAVFCGDGSGLSVPPQAPIKIEVKEHSSRMISDLCMAWIWTKYGVQGTNNCKILRT